jgi:hypothetical protein
LRRASAAILFSVLFLSTRFAIAEPSPAPDWQARIEALEKEVAALKAAQVTPPPSAPPAIPWYQQITLDAFVSTSYTWNFNEPKSGTNQIRATDYDHNSFRIDGAEVVLQKPVAEKGDVGFRLDLAFGPLARAYAARGLFRDPTTGQAGDIDLQQAFASYVIPVGTGLRVDLGKFRSPFGAESIEGYDGYNDQFSHSWLFLFSPFTHTGLRLTYAFNPKLQIMAMLVNGWDNFADNNGAKSFAVQATVKPHPMVNIYLAYMGGPERDNDDSDFRHYVDFGLVVKPHWRFTLTFNFDWGLDQRAIPEIALKPDPAKATDAMWLVGVLYTRVQLHKRIAVCLRGEVFWDRDGFRTGAPQTLGEFTGDVEFKIRDELVVRPEFRYDHSDVSFFENSQGGHRHQQTTLAINALYAF